MQSIRQQIHANAVALISLVIAVTALAYNTWRNETTEEQRNVRHASFRVLESLGDLQQVVDFRYYYLPFGEHAKAEGELRISGFGHVAMVRDLMMLMPAPGPGAGEELHRQWLERFGDLDDLDESGDHTAAATAAEREITRAIAQTREAVLEILQLLD
jgi:hypothetical protein